MKRCPTCNTTFEEEWLSFCTQDGTSLVEATSPPSEPPPTLLAPPQSDAAPPTWVTPSAELPPSAPQWEPPRPAAPAWQPPPPPAYASAENKNLATAAMVVGLVGVTIGWFCFGPMIGIAAIIMSAIALSQINKNPERYGGKPMALIGLITGIIPVVVYVGILIFYVIIFIAAAASSGVSR